MVYVFGGYELDKTRFELSRAGQALAVQPQVLELLIFLIEHRDRAVSRDEIFATIWKGRVVSDTTLSSRIKTARRTIGDDGEQQKYIRTIHGRGFRFVGAVETRGADEPPPETVGPAAQVESRPKTRYARSGDVHVAFQTFGAGPVNMVLTPGFVSHIDNYWDEPFLAAWLRQLGEIARVAMFDKRGTGMSDRVTALPGMDERMDDVRAVMDAAEFESAYILGVSEGGSLATLFAAHHPERCDGLILYGAFAQFKYWFRASMQGLFEYIESDWGTGNSLPQFAPSLADDVRYREWWGKFERLGATPGAAIALMKMNSRIDMVDVLPSIGVPCLVIHREQDVVIDVEAGRELARGIPGARYLEIEGQDHLPWIGNSDEIVAAIAAFVRQSERGSAPAVRALATIVLIRFGQQARKIAGSAEAMVRRELDRFRATHVESRPGEYLAAFDGPTRALECSVALSRLLAEAGVASRIGVHTGEVGVRDNALEGLAIGISSDVCEHARDGQVLVSRTVGDLVAGSGVILEDRGEHHLSTINTDWRLLEALPGSS